MSNVFLFLPELICLLAALLVFVMEMFRPANRVLWRLSMLGAIAVLGGALLTFGASGEPFFPGVYKVDLFSQLVKAGLAFGLAVVVFLTRRTSMLTSWSRRELPLFLFCSTFGMMMMVSSTELLTFYLGLEFSAYPLYIIVALHRNPRFTTEGAAKYVLQGAVASAIALYGISLLFGAAHSTYFAAIAAQAPLLVHQPIFLIGLLLTLSGLLFKLAAFPFHFWAPDVYTSASHQVVAFIATSSKLAAIAVLCRLVALLHGEPGRLADVIAFISIASMTLGNLAAIVQRDIKRMLAYSAVAHAGYVLVALCTFSQLGIASALFYAFAYLLMGLACFVAVCAVGEEDHVTTIQSFAGMYRRSPIIALTLMVGMLGMAGVPPTAGFVGKWFLFTAALSQGRFILVLVAAINSTIALFYYLRVLKSAYLDPPVNEEPLQLVPGTTAIALTLIVLIVLLGTIPGFFWGTLWQAAASL